MAATPEVKVKDKIKRALKEAGAYYTMPVMGGMASNGTPDFVGICCCQGFAIEAKAGKGKLTELQKVRLKEVRSAGGIALVINEEELARLDKVLLLLRHNCWSQARALSNLDDWL